MVHVCTHLLREMAGFHRAFDMISFLIAYKYSTVALYTVSIYLREVMDKLSAFEVLAPAVGQPIFSVKTIAEKDKDQFEQLFQS